MAEYVFREFPEHEPSAELLEARRIFESYGASVQSMRIQAGVGAITAGFAGGAKLSVPGAVIGAALGALTGYWKSKATRTQIYTQLDAMGLLVKPRLRKRGVWELHNDKFTFTRYLYAEQTALVILPILQHYYPNLTDAELTKIGHSSQIALMDFRKEYKDIPLALAAEVILVHYGVARNAAGDYDLITPPTRGQHFPPPPSYVDIPGEGHAPPPPPPGTEPNYLLYAALGIGAVLLLTR